MDDDRDHDDTPYIPSPGYVFPMSNEMVIYAKKWALSMGYALVIARSTTKDEELTRIYLQCDQGRKPKARQESSRLICHEHATSSDIIGCRLQCRAVQ